MGRSYSQIKPDLYVGRLYPTPWGSYCNLSRELRGLLVRKSEYLDFDMVNAHPTLLLEYVYSNMSEFEPEILTAYINNRDQLLEDKSREDNCSTDVAKRNLLKTLNTSENHAKTLGSFCSDLCGEVKVIRDHMYTCLLYTSPSPRDLSTSRMPSSA